ncbi:MAG: phosphoribosyl-ATP diphosphatase [Hyphomicrobiaceae bacterium]|nr:phosphoribosyl-ATP diphosphatase [Hyphomicrobiaceae bacterium]
MTDVLSSLSKLIGARRAALPDGSAPPSYTRELLDAGPERCARKFGEEALELVIAALAGGTTAGTDGKPIRKPLTAVEKDAMTSEAADVLYHLLVLLESRDVSWDDVTARLGGRMGTSGVAEKAARKPQ